MNSRTHFGGFPALIIKGDRYEELAKGIESKLADLMSASIQDAMARGEWHGLDPQTVWDRIVHCAQENLRMIMAAADPEERDQYPRFTDSYNMAFNAYLRKLKTRMESDSLDKAAKKIMDQSGGQLKELDPKPAEGEGSTL